MTNPPDSGDTGSSDWRAPGGDWGAPGGSGYSPTPDSGGHPGQPGGSAQGGSAEGGPAAPGHYSQPGQHGDQQGQYGEPGQYSHPGQYGQQPTTPGQYGQQGQYGDQQGQYGAPPPGGNFIQAQPGIIPLQPLALGQIYDGAFKAMRTNPIVMFVFAGVVVTVMTIVQSVLSASFFNDYFSLLGMAQDDPAAFEAQLEGDILSVFGNSLLPVLLSSVLTFIGSTILNGILTLAVSQAVLGFKPSLGQVWDQAKGQLLRLLGLVFLVAIITAVVPVVFVAITVAIGASGSVAFTVLFGLITALVSLCWVLFVITATALATPALMLERSGVIMGLRRSWQLAKPFFWRVLGIYLLTALIGAGVSYLIAMPAGFAVLFLPPTGMLIAQGISTVIASTLITPFTAGVLALLYIDIRIRREGLAAELAAAAQ